MAMCVFGGTAASSAFAEGPFWLVKGSRFDCEKVTAGGGQFNTLLECLGGSAGSGSLEWLLKSLTGTNGKLELDQGALALGYNLGNFKLTAGTLITIECTTLHSPTVLVGGVPGKDHATIHFSGCFVSGHPKCDANSPDESVGSGKINTAAKTELVLLEKGLGIANNLADLFEPESGTTFVTLTITSLEGSGNCPTFTQGETSIKGSVAALVEPTNTFSKEGMLTFPATPIATVWKWTGEDKWTKTAVSLKAFGIVESKQIGLADIKPVTAGDEAGADYS
jgi:hypothetical protein